VTEVAARFVVEIGVATDRGRRRQTNEDSYLATAPVCVVADGMGGHVGGAAASRAVVTAFASLTDLTWVSPADLVRAVAAATSAISALATPGGPAPGSTLSGVALAHQDGQPCWLVFNVGDSRTYRLAEGELQQLTVDHSVVQQLLDAGEIDTATARQHGDRNVITRAIGGGQAGPPSLDQWLLLAAPGDRILLCSDGLHGEVTDQLIAATLLASPDPAEAARRLVDAALSAGGRDNVTVVVVDAVRIVSGTVEGRLDESCDLDSPTVPRAAWSRAALSLEDS